MCAKTIFITSLATSLHFPLLDDVTKCTKVYDRIRPAKASTTHFHMSISSDSDQLSESDEMVPPKVIGVKVWTLNHEYVVIQKNYIDAMLNPCLSLGGPGLQRKAISGRNHINDCDTLMLLSSVDHDLTYVYKKIKKPFATQTRCTASIQPILFVI
jgi:hypothetical protein